MKQMTPNLEVITQYPFKNSSGTWISYMNLWDKDKARMRGEIMSEELKARTLKVEDLIEYQEGAVVSREIIRKGTGTVTIFAFDKGEGLSEHTAPFDAMVQVIDGKAEITISGNKNILEKWDMIIMPANESHALHAMERFKMILTMIRS
jgi:quercetin dioxygenase-like cupin family protein